MSNSRISPYWPVIKNRFSLIQVSYIYKRNCSAKLLIFILLLLLLSLLNSSNFQNFCWFLLCEECLQSWRGQVGERQGWRHTSEQDLRCYNEKATLPIRIRIFLMMRDKYSAGTAERRKRRFLSQRSDLFCDLTPLLCSGMPWDKIPAFSKPYLPHIQSKMNLGVCYTLKNQTELYSMILQKKSRSVVDNLKMTAVILTYDNSVMRSKGEVRVA